MPNYIGFSTINANKPRTSNPRVPESNYGSTSVVKPLVFGKKFRIVDAPLVIQDFINALNIQQGTKVGQPGYGTTIWSFVFEPNTLDVIGRLENEIKRVASLDPRMELNEVKAYVKENGILIEVQMSVTPFNQPLSLSIVLNNQTKAASLQ